MPIGRLSRKPKSFLAENSRRLHQTEPWLRPIKTDADCPKLNPEAHNPNDLGPLLLKLVAEDQPRKSPTKQPWTTALHHPHGLRSKRRPLNIKDRPRSLPFPTKLPQPHTRPNPGLNPASCALGCTEEKTTRDGPLFQPAPNTPTNPPISAQHKTKA